MLTFCAFDLVQSFPTKSGHRFCRGPGLTQPLEDRTASFKSVFGSLKLSARFAPAKLLV
jgi:hypothetical protein